jgi:hypothetical protein
MSSALPADLLDQVRGRVRILALLLLAAFGFDLVSYAIGWLYLQAGYTPTRDWVESQVFQWFNIGAAGASASLWYVAGSPRISATRLHTMGLVYEVAICLTISTLTFWQYYGANRMLPNLTWVPVVLVLFPLIMPGPPRRMLAAALAAGARGDRMEFDQELLVRMVWSGTPVHNLPTRVRYLRPEEGGVSHFRMLRDNLRISWLHTRLSLTAAWRRLRRGGRSEEAMR